MLRELNRSKNERGLTFIELLIVIAIIAILAAIAMPQFNQYKLRMYNNDAKANLHNIYLACKAYWTDNAGSEPCSIDIAKQEPYGFNASTNVLVTITPGKDIETEFEATAKHNTSSTTYTIDENDNIS